MNINEPPWTLMCIPGIAGVTTMKISQLDSWAAIPPMKLNPFLKVDAHSSLSEKNGYLPKNWCFINVRPRFSIILRGPWPHGKNTNTLSRRCNNNIPGPSYESTSLDRSSSCWACPGCPTLPSCCCSTGGRAPFSFFKFWSHFCPRTMPGMNVGPGMKREY